MRKLHPRILSFTPAIDSALARIETLEPSYAAGVQRVLRRGSFFLWELLISPADARRQKLVILATAWRQGRASEAQVLEAAGELATLMELVGGRGAQPPG